MNHKLNKPALMLFLIMVFSLSAIAQPMNGPAKQGKGRMMMSEELNLTADQEKQMQELRFDHDSRMIDLKAKLQAERLEMRKLMAADEPNEKKIYGQIEKISTAEVKIEKARIDHKLAVRKILTAEQLKIFRNEMGNRDGQFGHNRCEPVMEQGFHPRNNRP
ncbi:MAG: Spy/CpxP family protein refolding chaperone [Candidatus Marinimicrobia bacterium]|nr:Spy/CpxP family protein refolding chaperone [Candidatus Neomarinimicrobiota bacterium]